MTVTIILLNSTLSLLALVVLGVCVLLTAWLMPKADDEGRAHGRGPLFSRVEFERLSRRGRTAFSGTGFPSAAAAQANSL